MTILVLGTDEHAIHVAGRTGGLLVDTRDFPGTICLSWDEHGGGAIRLPDHKPPIPFAEIESVYWRSYDGVFTEGPLATDDARGLFESFLTIPTRWVNGWEGWRLHQTKPRCLAKVSALGVPVPKTLVTNDEELAVKFVERHRGQLIVKPVQGGWHTLRPVRTPKPWCGQPFTLQEFIPGTNIRVFVSGNEAVACEIATEYLDFRDDPNSKVTPHRLSAAMQKQSVRIAKELSLVWTGIDFRLTPDGQYVFLEANPSPMFLGFEQDSGLPLTEMLLNLLSTDILDAPPVR